MELYKLNELTLLADLDFTDLKDYLNTDEYELLTNLPSPEEARLAQEEISDILLDLTDDILETAIERYPDYEELAYKAPIRDIRYLPNVGKLLVLYTSEMNRELINTYIGRTITTEDGKSVGLELGDEYLTMGVPIIDDTPQDFVEQYGDNPPTTTKAARPTTPKLTHGAIEELYHNFLKSGIVAEFNNLDELMAYTKAANVFNAVTTSLYTYNGKYYVVHNISYQSVIGALQKAELEEIEQTETVLDRHMVYPIDQASALYHTVTTHEQLERTFATYVHCQRIELDEAQVLSKEPTYLIEEYGECLLDDGVYETLLNSFN